MAKIHSCKCGQTDPQQFYKGNKSNCKRCLIEKRKEYYRNNIEAERASYQKNRERKIAISKEHYRNNIISARLTAARNRCKTKGLEFDIIKEDIYNLMEKQRNRCAYSGRLMSMEANDINCISLDRIDNTRGYTKDNIQLVISALNYMKNSLSEEVFLTLVKEVCINNKLIS